MYAWENVDVPSLPPSSGDVPDKLTLFDTASQGLVEVAGDDALARMYVCGITPYDATHLGHANTYVTFDLINRAWRDLGLQVDYTQNVTDVDDPLLERAAETGVEWEELAEDQTELFRSDMQDLRVIPPTHYIGAVESIACVTELIDHLLPTGLIYQVGDDEHPDWYFNTAEAPGFGGVSHLDEATMIERFRDNGGDPERPGKRHPLDSLVWRYSREGEPSWSSPLGDGRPAGTSSAPRSRCASSAPTSTSRAAAQTWSSRTTRCAPRRPSSPAANPSRRLSCIPAWWASTARR